MKPRADLAEGNRERGRPKRLVDSAYLQDLKRFPPLTQQEQDLGRPFDPDRKQRMVEGSLRLVVRLVTRFQASGIDPDDLLGEANLAAVQAAKPYDPNRGVRFTSYLARAVVNRLAKCAARNSHAGRVDVNDGIEDSPASAIPSELSGQVQDWVLRLDDREQRVLRRRYGLGGGEPATLRELAVELNLSIERVRQIEGRALQRLRDFAGDNGV